MQHTTDTEAATPHSDRGAAVLSPPAHDAVEEDAPKAPPLLPSADDNPPAPCYDEEREPSVATMRATATHTGEAQQTVVDATLSRDENTERSALTERQEQPSQQEAETGPADVEEEEQREGDEEKEDEEEQVEEEEEREEEEEEDQEEEEDEEEDDLRDEEETYDEENDEEFNEEEEEEDYAGDEEQEEEEEGDYEPPGDEDQSAASKKGTFFIRGRRYAASAFVHNVGFTAAQKKLRGNPKATVTMCTLPRPHNILKCPKLHLTNRAVMVGDCYVRINMLVNNPARVALLSKPSQAAGTAFCTDADAAGSEGHDATTCTALHLLPGIVFVGSPELKVGYFEAELHDNIALQRLKSGTDTCGRWCRTRRSHVVVKCSFVHYNRGSTYTEAPRQPSMPLAVVPSLRPRLPRPAVSGGRGGRGRGGRGGRGRGGRGGGRGRGYGRGGSGGGRGILRHPAAQPLFSPATAVANVDDDLGGSVTGMGSPLSEDTVQARKEQFLNIMLLLLGFIVTVLAYLLS